MEKTILEEEVEGRRIEEDRIEKKVYIYSILRTAGMKITQCTWKLLILREKKNVNTQK